jgi:hypothetical protein
MLNAEGMIARKFGKYRRASGQKGTEYIVKCTACGRPKMYINPVQEVFNCFRCGKSGTLSELFGELAHGTPQAVPEVQQQRMLGDRVGMPGALTALQNLSESHPARQYIARRKFDHQELNDVFGVRYCYEGQWFGGHTFNTTNTLILPLWFGGKVVGWQSRLLYDPDSLTEEDCKMFGFMQDDDGEYVRPPKYFTSPGLEKGRALYNYDNARQSELVVITEGPFDAIAVGRCAVATLGKGVTEHQANAIKSYWQLAVVMLDPGDADKEMQVLTARLHRTIRTIVVQLQGYKDPGECPRDEIWRQISAQMQRFQLDATKYRTVI